MFNSERDLPETVEVPLEYPYIFETDKDGAVVKDPETQQPRLHKFKFVMLRKRASEIDQEETARIKQLVSGAAAVSQPAPLTEIDLLARLTVSHLGFDDFPEFTDRKDFEEKMRLYFSPERKKHFVNDALLRHQHILLPVPFRVSV